MDIVYRTSDGKLFDDGKIALMHEKALELKEGNKAIEALKILQKYCENMSYCTDCKLQNLCSKCLKDGYCFADFKSED